MVKERTPLLLVFGSHPGKCGPLALEGDREFFRGNFTPFVESRVVSAGKSAIMIHEYNMACTIGNPDSPDDMARLRQHLDSVRESINSMLGRTLGAGKGLERNMEWFDWGCADEIIRVNRAKTGTIKSVIEPLCAEAAYLLGRSESGDSTEGLDARIESEKRMVARSVEICRLRSTMLAGYIKDLRREHPERPIMVTRGFAHKGMESFFDESEFDITSASRLISAPFPSTEAVIKGMTGRISDYELTRFARLSLHFGDYYQSNMLSHMLDSIEDGVFDERKFALLSHRAMEHALRMSES